MAETAQATEPPHQVRVPTNKVRALIEAHIASYVALSNSIHKVSGCSDYDRVNREEERALIAICAYPAVSEGDRLAKARYLLEVEARGELDLPEHMQALLHSTMSRT